MKRKFLALTLIMLITLSLACSLGNLINDGEDSGSTGESAPQGEGRCGNGICGGPENPQNCPEDCPSEAQSGSPSTDDESASGDGVPSTPSSNNTPPLYIGVSVHLEAWKLGNEKLGYEQQVYERYVQNILAYSDLANSYDMPFTWETSNLIDPSAALEPNVLLELYQRGDGIGVHADLGEQTPYPGGEAQFTKDLRILRHRMEDLGIPVTHASGVCSTSDWVTAALDAGFEAVTGTVDYCLKSLPLDQQSAEIQECKGPALCHDPYPGQIPEMLHPWRAADGSSWTTPAEEGLLVFSTAGALPCSAGSGSQPQCDLQIIEEALAARQPGEFHSFFFVWSYGSPLEEELLRNFYEGLQPYIESGDVVWKTMPELIEAYQAFEGSAP
ncbi:MAG: hypothetical protein MAG431_00784 [Chloroflexi bacterium]|nr:hypothetical protein [Chloroflexota bacterium]